jgi:hypothetical protein
MNGYVDDGGRALLDIELQTGETTAPIALTVWIDTCGSPADAAPGAFW